MVGLCRCVVLIDRVRAQPEMVPLQAAGSLAGKSVAFSGRGECHQSGDASIYGVPAAMYHASFSGGTSGLERVNLTLWQPKAGGPMQMTFAADAGRTHFEIGTVKGGRLTGSGTGRVDRQGAGGALVVQGQTASGAAVQLTVTCSRFTAPEDNG